MNTKKPINKKIVIILFTLLVTAASAQINNPAILFNGLYVAKTGEVTVDNKKMDSYTYIRFYKNGTVYTQTETFNDPKKVAENFGKGGRFERKGTFTILKNGDVEFLVSNDKSRNKKTEGPKTDKYGGQLKGKDRLFLVVKYANGDLRDYWFDFIKTDKK